MGTLDNNDKKQQDADKKAGDDGCKSKRPTGPQAPLVALAEVAISNMT